MQEVAKDRAVLTPPRKTATQVEDEMPKGIRNAWLMKLINDVGGRCVSTNQSIIAKKVAVVGQVC